MWPKVCMCGAGVNSCTFRDEHACYSHSIHFNHFHLYRYSVFGYIYYYYFALTTKLSRSLARSLSYLLIQSHCLHSYLRIRTHQKQCTKNREFWIVFFHIIESIVFHCVKTGTHSNKQAEAEAKPKLELALRIPNRMWYMTSNVRYTMQYGFDVVFKWVHLLDCLLHNVNLAFHCFD